MIGNDLACDFVMQTTANRAVTVYGLTSSEDGKIRYVGQTVRSLRQRLRCHLKDAEKKDSHVQRWIRAARARGADIQIFPVEENAVLHESERRWITHFLAQGASLTNVTEGGEGTHGYKWTPEQIDMISRRRKGRVITPEWKANISAGIKGRPKPSGFGAKISASRKGKPLSPEHIRKRSEARRGTTFKMNEDGRAHIKEAKRRLFAARRASERERLPAECPAELSGAIRWHRLRADMSRQSFATAIGTTVVSVGYWERGKCDPSPEARAALDAFFRSQQEALNVAA